MSENADGGCFVCMENSAERMHSLPCCQQVIHAACLHRYYVQSLCQLEEGWVKCPHCRQPIPDARPLCGLCGDELPDPIPTQPLPEPNGLEVRSDFDILLAMEMANSEEDAVGAQAPQLDFSDWSLHADTIVEIKEIIREISRERNQEARISWDQLYFVILNPMPEPFGFWFEVRNPGGSILALVFGDGAVDYIGNTR